MSDRTTMAGDSKETDEGLTARRADERDVHARAERATSLSRRGNRIAGFIVITLGFVLVIAAFAWWSAG